MMKVDGRCHCGRISYEAEIDPAEVSVCHCTDCQALTGTAYRVTVMTPRDKVRMTGAEPRTYVKTADNGNPRIQQFCPDCGSPVLTTGEGKAAEMIGLRWGSIRQRRKLVPRKQIWCRSAAPFIHDLADLPGRDGD
jgi:hypothetical protein